MLDPLNDEHLPEYRSYVESLVARLIQSMNLPSQMRQDFISAGYLGLVEAARRFDVTRGAEFRSYAFLRIKGAVIDSIRQQCNISNRAYRMLRALESSNEINLTSDRLIATEQTVKTRRRLAEILEYLSKTVLAHRLIAVGQIANNDEPKSVETPETTVANKQEFSRLLKLVDELPELERKIIKQHYFQEKRFVDIVASEAGMSKSWVSRIHTRALTKLKERYLQELANETH